MIDHDYHAHSNEADKRLWRQLRSTIKQGDSYPMASENQNQLVLAQNQYALTQETTKGLVQVYAGPHSVTLSQQERTVVYDKQKDAFIAVDPQQAVKQNPLAAEGEYIVLENPVEKDDKLYFPKSGTNMQVELRAGSKINIQGPRTFPLWPGQFATVIPGHHLRSNQYLIVRVYNAEEAGKNATPLLRSTAAPNADPESVVTFTPGQLLVIKGTEASFFIPPTGFEVLRDSTEAGKGNYVREALTLERLEYAILLDEDGNKRYERGPQVVFPEATETFMTRREEKEGEKSSSRKFKAIELNDQMGLYIKVIADYVEEVHDVTVTPTHSYDDAKPLEAYTTSRPLIACEFVHDDKVFRSYVTGEELFITGKEQRIYYPRPEHALIGYDDPKSNFKRERYYGITIPKGEGRYVLDKQAGDIKLVKGPQIFLPDPRNQVIVRRVLDAKAVSLWYPGNVEAMAFNQGLRAITDESAAFLAEATVQTAMADISRGLNRMTTSNVNYAVNQGSDVIGGQRMQRGTKFTPPPMLTLNNKYEGVPAINVWTGYAVQVVDRSGNRRVVVGPATILLEYDETLEMFMLSTGKPKTTDNLVHDVYLRVDSNLVSDIVKVTTKDFVEVNVKLSYRVNFLPQHKERWFAVENYVKYLCDHMRSMLKADARKRTVGDYMDNYIAVIRDVVLGVRPEAKEGENSQRHRLFTENGMDVYDVEVLSVEPADADIAEELRETQRAAVQSTIQLVADKQKLETERQQTLINKELTSLQAERAQHEMATAQETAALRAKNDMLALEAEIAEAARRREDEAVQQTHVDSLHEHELTRRKAADEQDLAMEREHTKLFSDRMAAISPNLITAVNNASGKRLLGDVTAAIAPLAIAEHQGLGQTLERVFKGSVLEPILENLKKE